MSDERETILIKRYASRRLYNTSLSDYVTLEEVASYIKDGKDVKIIDRKTGDDLTRQYLLQIITDCESRGENILPINVLFDIVRSYSDQAQNFIPDFLSQSFEMLKNQQAETLKTIQNNIKGTIPPLQAPMEGLEKWQEMQSAFLNKMMGAWAASPDNCEKSDAENEAEEMPDPPAKKPEFTPPLKSRGKKSTTKDKELEALKKQLASLQSKLEQL